MIFRNPPLHLRSAGTRHTIANDHKAEIAEDGGLIAYGTRPVARYIPVEQPAKFEPVINLKTAKVARPHNPAVAARPRRRGDRMRASFAAMQHVSFGSWLCKNTAAWKIDRTNLPSDPNLGHDNFQARSILSNLRKTLLLVVKLAAFSHS